MLKLTRTKTPLKVRIQNYKEETDKKKLRIYTGFFSIIFAGSAIALNQSLINMSAETELTFKNAIEYLAIIPIIMSSSIGLYFNIEKIQNIARNNSKPKVKTHK